MSQSSNTDLPCPEDEVDVAPDFALVEVAAPRVGKERVLISRDLDVDESRAIAAEIGHERDGLGILELRPVAIGLGRVRRIVERVLDRHVLGAKVWRDDAEREAAAGAVGAAGRRG